MDERIKALAKQAGFPEWSEKTIGFELEKFAELIVTEDARDEVKRLREELRVSRQSTTILIESLDSDIERLRKDKAELLKMLNQMLDDMGATGHSVCGAVKAMGRYIIAKHQTDEEAFLDYTIHQAVKVLLEVDMISNEQAKAAIAKATGDE